MQPLSGSDNKGALLSTKAIGGRQEPLNTEAFWRKKVDDVAVDEVFFHRYFNHTGKSKRTAKSKDVAARDPNTMDGDDDDNEDEIWQALVNSRPEVEGPSDDESDMEMLDLEDSDAASSAAWSDADSEVDVEDDSIASGISDNEDNEDGEFDFADEEGGDDEDLDGLFSKEVEKGNDTGVEKTGEETSRQRKKRMKSLPTFASAEDYAEMLNNDEDEDF